MNVKLDIPTGEWRDLTSAELKTINNMVSDSSKTPTLPEKPYLAKNKFTGTTKHTSDSEQKEKEKHFRKNKNLNR